MVKPLHCCVFLPVTLLAAFCTDTGQRSKFVCIGDSVLVFQDITSTSFNNIIIYKTFGNKSEPIMTLSIQNVSNKYLILPKFKDKLSFENGAILIHNFQATDEATYTMLYNDVTKRKNVDICELVPPTLHCKPNIVYDGNVLTASLNHPGICGKPLASVIWMDYPYVSYSSESVIELPTGTTAGTYIACIESEALKCMKNSSEWHSCTNYTIESANGNNFPRVSDIVGALYPLITTIKNENLRTAVSMTVEQLKDVVVKTVVESIDRQFALLEKMNKRILDEKQMVIDEKQALINEKEVLLKTKDTTIKNLQSKLEKLEARFDDLEQNGLRSSIRLNNVKLGNDESCAEKVVDVITNITNVSISRDDIERCHPLGKPNRNGNRQLMIKFKSYKIRAKVFSQRKNMKRNDLGIYMTKDLTRPKSDLLNKLLKYKTSKRIEAFWIVDGKIYARKYPGSYPKRINTMQDIEHLLVNAESSFVANNEGKR